MGRGGVVVRAVLLRMRTSCRRQQQGPKKVQALTDAWSVQCLTHGSHGREPFHAAACWSVRIFPS